MAAVQAIRAVDAHTIEIETARPFPILLNAPLQFPIMGRVWSKANGAALASDLAANTDSLAPLCRLPLSKPGMITEIPLTRDSAAADRTFTRLIQPSDGFAFRPVWQKL